ncbi:MAG: biotin/lipoyl-containing protein [Bdellovibrionia bacterium]
MDLKVKVNGKDHRAVVQIVGGQLWVHHRGKTFSVETQQGRRARKKAGQGGSSDTVSAPMPGKVTKILVTQGQNVEAGAAILVMEAMKMEYTLKAEVAGAVESINCQVGDQVVLGKILVKLSAN